MNFYEFPIIENLIERMEGMTVNASQDLKKEIESHQGFIYCSAEQAEEYLSAPTIKEDFLIRPDLSNFHRHYYVVSFKEFTSAKSAITHLVFSIQENKIYYEDSYGKKTFDTLDSFLKFLSSFGCKQAVNFFSE
jgi:hypothetical protein